MTECIRFVSHSCISITVDTTTLLCDPWFFGKVFEDSWCHVLEPGLSEVDLRTLRYIWISHEHPDHLHFPTLKYISENVEQRVQVLYREEYGARVAEALQKLGFGVVLLAEDTPHALDGIGEVRLLSHHYDAALLIRTPASTILNMNDCALAAGSCRKIRRYSKHIDYLFFQFSLAGYHANATDSVGLRKAQRNHLAMTRKYADCFQPAWYVPFASFIRFCTPYNEFMNDWRIPLARVSDAVGAQRLQVVFNGDLLLDEPEAIAARNASNIRHWRDTIDSQAVDVTEREPASDKVIEAAATAFVDGFSDWPTHGLPRPLVLYLQDIDCSLRVDIRAGTFRISSGKLSGAIASLCSSSCVALMTTPWGADTLNITAELEVYRLYPWRWLLFCKHYTYKPVVTQRWGLYIPRLWALVKTLVNR